MPESTVELLKRAVDATAKTLDKPVPDRRELEEDAAAERVRAAERKTR
jgi:hypothetical protein